MRKLKLEPIFEGLHWKHYSQRCVYGWFRYTECLYIGQSRSGITRIFKHDVIGKLEKVLDNDTFRFAWFTDKDPKDALDFWEERLIKQYRPRYNLVHNTNAYAKETRERAVSELRKSIRKEKELAKVLFDEMSKRPLLANPQDRSLRKLTDRQLKRRVEEASLVSKHMKDSLKDFMKPGSNEEEIETLENYEQARTRLDQLTK